jgi:predicted RNA binding protein YcfA (HicA-like mRNA interferase family)
VKPVTGKQMCRALRHKGWTLDHIRGSHHVYRVQGRLPVTVPVHAGQTLARRTQRSIMKAAGLTDDDL